MLPFHLGLLLDTVKYIVDGPTLSQDLAELLLYFLRHGQVQASAKLAVADSGGQGHFAASSRGHSRGRTAPAGLLVPAARDVSLLLLLLRPQYVTHSLNGDRLRIVIRYYELYKEGENTKAKRCT